MQQPPEALDGPEFLDALADIALGTGDTVGADAYRKRGLQWNQDKAEIERLRTESTRLQNALNNVRSALPVAA